MNEFISAHLLWCRNKNHRERSLHERRRILEQADRQLPLGILQANEEEIRAWLDTPGWKPATRTLYWTHLRQAYLWGYRSGGIDINPMENIDRPKPPRPRARPVRGDLAEELLRTLPEPWNTFVLLAWAGGLRCCEIAGLHRDDITERLITVRQEKGGGQGTVQCHPAIWSRVQGMSGSIPEAVGGVADARWISIRSANYFRFRLKMPGISLHRFRHSHGTDLRAEGADLFKVKRALRHKSIQSTDIYVDVGDAELHRAVTGLRIPTTNPDQR